MMGKAGRRESGDSSLGEGIYQGHYRAVRSGISMAAILMKEFGNRHRVVKI